MMLSHKSRQWVVQTILTYLEWRDTRISELSQRLDAFETAQGIETTHVPDHWEVVKR